MNGFGPSTGRFVEVNESAEERRKRVTRPMPPAISILSLTAAFLSFVFGLTSLYEKETVFGSILVAAGIALVGFPIIWMISSRE